MGLGFIKMVVGELANPEGRGAMNTFLAVGDITRNGLPDVVLCGRNGRMAWFENPGKAEGWTRHIIADVENQECGGSLIDLTGNGLLDIINGGDWQSNEVSWWENPGEAGGTWPRRVAIEVSGTQIHDTAIGDVTGDGTLSLVFTNQHAEGGTTVYRVPIPQDPMVSPWPGLEVIGRAKTEPNPYRDEGVQPEEGVAIGDLDGDGRNEVIAGTHWYKRVDGKWQAYKFATGYITTKIAIGDLDGDGQNEIVLSEGDPCVYGKTQGGKLAWFKPGADITQMWKEHVLEDGLLDAHSLRLADLTGNGHLDILTGEVGLADQETGEYIGHLPRITVYENDGEANFGRRVIDEGTGAHDAWLADMRGKGVLDIVTRPLQGAEKWHLHVYYNERGGAVE
jgi:hypothetical protein